MFSAKWLISILMVCVFWFFTQKSYGEQDLEEEIIEKIDNGRLVRICKKVGYTQVDIAKESGRLYKRLQCRIIKCSKGECTGRYCSCCAGYGLKETGLWSKSYSCEKCNCGKNIDCSFGWLSKTCKCPAGYSYSKGFCRKFPEGDWSYLLLFKGLAILVICRLILAITTTMKDFFLVSYLISKLFMYKLLRSDLVIFTSNTESRNDIYKKICSLIQKILNLTANDATKNPEVSTVPEFMYCCPICARSQEEIFLGKGSIYAMKCGHILCNSCITQMTWTAIMERTPNVSCAICRDTNGGRTYLKLLLLSTVDLLNMERKNRLAR